MISIITPVLNREKFIEGCIQNVLDQNCYDLEHLIIDGGSTDATVDIIKQYAGRYPHIRWISEKDQGQSDAMNKGIWMAKGDILGILNVDDFYEPGTLNRVLSLFKTLPVPTFLVGNCNFWDAKGQLMSVQKPKGLTLWKILASPTKVYPFPANGSMYFYHRTLHDLAGLYKIDEHYVMDLDFVLRVVQAAHVEYVDETWGNFRYHEETKTFQDRRRGENQKRADYYFDFYRKKLPWLQRMSSALSYTYHENPLCERVRYYATHADQLFLRLHAKLIRRSET